MSFQSATNVKTARKGSILTANGKGGATWTPTSNFAPTENGTILVADNVGGKTNPDDPVPAHWDAGFEFSTEFTTGNSELFNVNTIDWRLDQIDIHSEQFIHPTGGLLTYNNAELILNPTSGEGCTLSYNINTNINLNDSNIQIVYDPTGVGNASYIQLQDSLVFTSPIISVPNDTESQVATTKWVLDLLAANSIPITKTGSYPY